MSNTEMRGVPELPRFRAFLPEFAELSARFPRPRQQGALGSCAAWAVGYATRSYYTSTSERKPLTDANIVSPSYLYHRARRGACDEGSSVADNVRVLRQGALSLADHPYSDRCETIAPELANRAKAFKVDDLARLDHTRVDDVRGRLAQGEPVILSLRIWPSFHDYRGGIYRVGSTSGEINYHAVVTTGYDDRRQALRVVNSWGTKWGEGGYMWLSYDAYAAMAVEAVVLRVAGFTPTPPVEPVDTVELAKLVTDVNTRTCANVAFRKEGESVIVSGFVGSEEDLKRIKDLAATKSVLNIDGLAVASWPQCELKQILARAAVEPDKPGVTVADVTALHSGRLLDVTVRAPQHFSYAYVSYVQADQTIVHLAQPQGPGSQLEPGQELRFGDGKEGRSKFTVSPPLGREMMLVVTSRSPLFEKTLPQVQTAREYLSLLRKALIYRPRADLPERVIAASTIEFETKAAP
ncbi:C1 family peptidase [Neorhizobium sp. T7_12]|uniref:C1 family peptidase n=1 Tax=Neorhizobium sp. T7_12 TaxID=2093832 RepID=UPI00155F3638|nr:C1 family peptidase [Neorhizobium sp. T7_12]